jgi:hypothetical protein
MHINYHQCCCWCSNFFMIHSGVAYRHLYWWPHSTLILWFIAWENGSCLLFLFQYYHSLKQYQLIFFYLLFNSKTKGIFRHVCISNKKCLLALTCLPSVCYMCQPGCQCTDVQENWYWRLTQKSVNKNPNLVHVRRMCFFSPSDINYHESTVLKWNDVKLLGELRRCKYNMNAPHTFVVVVWIGTPHSLVGQYQHLVQTYLLCFNGFDI